MKILTLKGLPQLWLAAGFVVGLDQLSKWWASSQGWVIFNHGISGGLGQALPTEVWLTVSLAIILGLVVFNRQSLSQWPVWSGLWLGGSLSNWLDRLMLGGVRDWLPIPGLDVHNNLADWAIFIGLAMWMVLSLAMMPTQISSPASSKKPPLPTQPT